MNEFGGVKTKILVVILVLAAVAYYGTEVGSVYWRKYSLGDSVQQELAFVGQRSDEGIRQHIAQDIADMKLPPEARRFRFARNPQTRSLEFSVSYTETVNLLFTTKEIPLTVSVRRRY